MSNTKYGIIVDELERDILQGKFNEIKKLPTEEELINKYGVSRTTIRKAISVLVSRGYVYQIQGSGIFLREAATKGYFSLERLKGFTRERPDEKVESKVIDLKIIEATEEMAHEMRCDVGSPIYYLKRLRILRGKPATMEYTYFNKKIIPYLSEEIATTSIYSYIMNDLGLTIGFADRIIYADKLTAENANYFGLQEGDPTLVIDSKEFLSTGEIFALARALHHYQEVKLLKLATF